MTVEQSYQYCRAVSKSSAKNFYYSFVLLSNRQKNAMCAVYAFMRYCDDLSDEPGATVGAIIQWREALKNALQGCYGAHPIWPAFHDAVNRFHIPHQYFFDMIDGVASDLTPEPIENFEDLYRYCYKVASVVGMTTVHIFGFDSPRALELAETCGIAFQLTNILRDVREDAGLGRQYLPTEDLVRFHVDPEDLALGKHTPNFHKLMEFQERRARKCYDDSAPLIGMVHQRSRASLWALISIYSRLLDRIRTSGYDVLAQRISLPKWEKRWIVMQALVR